MPLTKSNLNSEPFAYIATLPTIPRNKLTESVNDYQEPNNRYIQ